MWNVVGNGDVKYGGERLMWNVVENGGVKYGGLLWCGIWWITLTLECGSERWCEMRRRTVMWNAPENGYVKYGGER